MSRAPADPLPLSAAERRLAGLLRFFAALFLVGALAFFVRPNGTLADLDRVGAALGLASLPPRDEPLAADFWLALAVANMATIAACSWLAAGDVRRRRALVYPLIVSKLTSSTAGVILFVTRAHALAYLSAPLVDLPIAVVTVAALRAALPPGDPRRI
ncbi:MAG: hypothetical protein E6J71_19310 [Deltaproteobacteria bacterium]|nr:MAG: hypothetical protein E6J77_18090 [Deltaproteobacteria bacterium]TMB15462.1 MAG: hypothetical protein E6J71_19310 [Deltaproteobacteria bacterium]